MKKSCISVWGHIAVRVITVSHLQHVNSVLKMRGSLGHAFSARLVEYNHTHTLEIPHILFHWLICDNNLKIVPYEDKWVMIHEHTIKCLNLTYLWVKQDIQWENVGWDLFHWKFLKGGRHIPEAGGWIKVEKEFICDIGQKGWLF